MLMKLFCTVTSVLNFYMIDDLMHSFYTSINLTFGHLYFFGFHIIKL